MKIYNERNRMGDVWVLYGYTQVMWIPTNSRDYICAMIIATKSRYTTYRQSNDFQKRGMTVPESQPLPQTINVPEVQERNTVRNPADRPSRRPDYEIGYKTYCTTFSTLAAVEPYDDYLLSRQPRLPTHWLPTWPRKSSIFPMVGYPDLTEW